MVTLPSYKAAMSHPIAIDTDSPSPHRATLRAVRTEDNQDLGGTRPGTVHQESYFEGTWDAATGVLSGEWTHSYSTDIEAVGNTFATKVEYRMSGTMEARRVEGTNRIEGTITGPNATTTIHNEGASQQPPVQSEPVNWTVSGELPDGL
jgi:hypothetical protein